MKLAIKTLSLTLVLASLVGACSSVNSSTPSVEEPSVNSGIELESPQEIESAEELPTESAEIENSGFGSSEESQTNLNSTETELESADSENIYLDKVEQETPEIESSEAPIESEGSEIILPTEDAAQTPIESQAAENSTLEPAQ